MIYKNKSKLIKHIEKVLKIKSLIKILNLGLIYGILKKIQSSIIDFRFNFCERLLKV